MSSLPVEARLDLFRRVGADVFDDGDDDARSLFVRRCAIDNPRSRLLEADLYSHQAQQVGLPEPARALQDEALPLVGLNLVVEALLVAVELPAQIPIAPALLSTEAP